MDTAVIASYYSSIPVEEVEDSLTVTSFDTCDKLVVRLFVVQRQ